MRWWTAVRWVVAAAALVCAAQSPLSDSDVRKLLEPNPAPQLDFRKQDSLLARILIPRVPGTDNNTRVREALIGALRVQKDVSGAPKWHITTQSFDAPTPEGVRRMTNVIATRDPHAARHLVLAAHLDSKFFPPGPMQGFVGATDSAAPCAIMVDVALALEKQLDAYTARQATARAEHAGDRVDDRSLQLVFLDGEEAFHQWSATDSVYGARALASALAHTYVKPGEVPLVARHTTGRGHAVRAIQQMEHFVLLDLLGAPNTSVPFYFDATHFLHTRLHDVERRLAALQALWPPGDAPHAPLIDTQRGPHGISDDHLPFLREGVPILHVIPYPFPSVWHEVGDDASALDYATVCAWSKLLRVFVAEVLKLAS